jgi:amino acid transporter
MVAGWDAIVPAWFSKLQPRYKTPINSILFVAAVTLAFAIASLIGVGAQEAFQLIDNAAGIFYAIAYMVLFAIPICGFRHLEARAPLWLRASAAIGFAVSVLYIVLTVFPIVEVESHLWFAVKIVLTTVVANLIGGAIYIVGRKAPR